MTKQYKIGEVAKQLNTTLRTIRYYEEEGLLTPIRSQGGTRFYTATHINRLKVILFLTENGFSLQTIKQIAKQRQLAKTGNESSKKVCAQLNSEIANLNNKLANLSVLHEQLLKAKEIVSLCQGCNNKPTSKTCPNCPVKRQMQHVSLLHLIWDQEE